MAKRGPAKKRPARMTDEHKAALAAGRAEGRAVRNYLDALELQKRSRGRSRSPESISRRLSQIHDDMAGADPVTRLGLIQERRDLERQLSALGDDVDLDALQAAFVAVAKAYSERKGIERASWREAGVPASVLKAAGIQR
jgi:hypothetical protein